MQTAEDSLFPNSPGCLRLYLCTCKPENAASWNKTEAKKRATSLSRIQPHQHWGSSRQVQTLHPTTYTKTEKTEDTSH